MIRHPRTFIIVTIILLCVAVVFVVIVWWLLMQTMSPGLPSNDVSSVSHVQSGETVQPTTANDNQSAAAGDGPVMSSDIPFASAADLPLTEGQRATAQTLGINLAGITITPELISCVIDAVGEVRYEEIVAGTTPSFLEGVAIARCVGQ